MRALTLLYLFSAVAFSAAGVSCLSNTEFIEFLKEYSTDYEVTDADDIAVPFSEVADDVIDFKGGPDDELDSEYFISRLVEIYGIENATVIDEFELSESSLEHLLHNLGIRGSCRCGRSSCSCCVSHTFKVRVFRKKFKFRLKACVTVKYVSRDKKFLITVTVNGYRLYKREIRLRRSISLCYPVPRFRAAKVCLVIYNVNLRRRSMCAKLTGKVKLGFKTIRINVKLGCFRIRMLEDEALESLDRSFDLSENADSLFSSVVNDIIGKIMDVYRQDLKQSLGDPELFVDPEELLTFIDEDDTSEISDGHVESQEDSVES